MTSQNHAYSEEQLQAWVDDRLDQKQTREIGEWLKQHPELAQELETYRQYNESLKQLYDPVLQESVPERIQSLASQSSSQAMKPVHKQRKPWFSLSQAAGVLLAVSIGMIAGWISHDQYQQRTTVSTAITERLVQDAFAYHVVYTPEVLHPVEVSASEQQHLSKWLSKRLKTTIVAPSLEQLGFKLLGGRLLESGNQPAAQFMYEDLQGHRLTLLARRRFNNETETAFRYASEGNINGFYWVDDQLSFVIVSDIPRTEISKISHAVYQALNS